MLCNVFGAKVGEVQRSAYMNGYDLLLFSEVVILEVVILVNKGEATQHHERVFGAELALLAMRLNGIVIGEYW